MNTKKEKTMAKITAAIIVVMMAVVMAMMFMAAYSYEPERHFSFDDDRHSIEYNFNK